MNEKNVHDLRVLIRRILSFAGFINEITNSHYFLPLKSELKRVLKVLNPLRDVQVQILKVKRTTAPDSPIMDYFYYLLKLEKDYLAAARRELTKKTMTDLSGLFFFFNLDLKSKSLTFEELLAESKQISDKVISELKNAIKKLDYSDLTSIHNLRLAFKKYRYTIEILQLIFEERIDTNTDLKQFQTILGAIQDNNILLEIFSLFLSSVNVSTPGYEKYKGKILRNRALLIDTLRKNNRYLNTIEIRLLLNPN
jgi:CHAD domain-containing protein